MTISRPMIVTMMNALISLITACTGLLPIEADMNRFSPTGGVISPTHVDEIMIAPKCTSEMPNLTATGAKIVALTGVSLSEGKTGVMGLDTATGEYYVYQNDRVPASYHGTGDIYSSVAVGAIMAGKSWQDALRIAADFTARTIEVTLQDPKEPWYGVDFEAVIPELCGMLK